MCGYGGDTATEILAAAAVRVHTSLMPARKVSTASRRSAALRFVLESLVVADYAAQMAQCLAASVAVFKSNELQAQFHLVTQRLCVTERCFQHQCLRLVGEGYAYAYGLAHTQLGRVTHLAF